MEMRPIHRVILDELTLIQKESTGISELKVKNLISYFSDEYGVPEEYVEPEVRAVIENFFS